MTSPVTKDIEIGEGMSSGRALLWRDGEGARYHIWLKAPTEAGLWQVEIIYKNSVVMKSAEPGWFRTRQLDATKPKNVALLRQVYDAAIAGNLWAKAVEKERQARAAEHAENLELIRVSRIKEAGPALLAILIEMRDSAQLVAGGRPTLQGIIAKADAMIADLGAPVAVEV